MTTNAYAAKRAIYDRLLEYARTGPLSKLAHGGEPVQVLYDGNPREMQDVCLFGGPVQFDRDPDSIISDGIRELVRETASTSWFIRVVGPADMSIAHLDEIAEAIGEAFGQLLADEPHLAGPGSTSRLFSGLGDYDFVDDENRTTLGYQVHTESMIE